MTWIGHGPPPSLHLQDHRLTDVKSAVYFDGILFHFFSLSGSLGGTLTGDFLPRLETEADLTGAADFLTSYSVNNFNWVFICRASSWPGLGSLRRRLLSACLCSCLRPFGWWSLWPHWVVRFHPCDIGMNGTRHHLFGRNRRKKGFCARQQPRGLLHKFPRIRVGTFFFCFYLLYFCFPFPYVAFF